MNFAFQTIACGPAIENGERLVDILSVIRESGFQGVEFAQSPSNLGVGSLRELSEALEGKGLRLAGLAGGTVEERVRWCTASPEGQPDYFYIENCDRYLAIRDCVREAYSKLGRDPPQLALHPHAFITLRSELAPYTRPGPGVHTEILAHHHWRHCLARYSDLQLIPDTAHLWVMGEHPVSVIRDPEYFPRIAAVHVKDWTLMGGRSSLRYARGFRNLRQGKLPLEAVMRELRGFAGWVVAEIDRPEGSLEACIKEAGAWLQAHA